MVGLATLAHMIYQGVDRAPILSSLTSRAASDPDDAAALMDLSTVVQLTGERDQGLAIQAHALGLARVYRCVHGGGSGIRLLALCAPGDFMANTPLDFLLDGSDVTVYYAFSSDTELVPSQLPEHDAAVVCIAESEPNTPVLAALSSVTNAWRVGTINRHTPRIAALARDTLPDLFTDDERHRRASQRACYARRSRACSDRSVVARHIASR